MEEQTSWKGHAFTLMIFGGIVVLCSIFFVLGMLVGRTQTVKIGTVAAAEAAAKAQPKEAPHEDKPDLTFYESVEKNKQPAPALSAPPPAPKPREDPPPAKAAASPANTINLQVAALKKQSDAEKQVEDLRKKGFRAFILSPSSDDTSPFYRVQIGASDQIEAESLRQQLEAAGIKAIIKK